VYRIYRHSLKKILQERETKYPYDKPVPKIFIRYTGTEPKHNTGVNKLYRKYIPSVIIDLKWFLTYHLKYSNIERNAIIVNSIPKSGTHYLMYLITNYLYLHFFNIEKPVNWKKINSDDLKKVLFPNTIDRYEKYFSAPKDHIIHKTGYSDLIWGHKFSHFERSVCRRIVHLYRNPLDFIISNYYYQWENNSKFQKIVNEPKQVIDLTLNYFILHYNYIKKLSAIKSNILRLSYEQLKLSPQESLQHVLSWLEFPINESLVRKAAEFSSKKNIRAQEKEKGVSFVRSGKIGEWKKIFSNKSIDYINTKLRRHHISTDEFILE